jgi:tryptophan-rich sensory protein
MAKKKVVKNSKPKKRRFNLVLLIVCILIPLFVGGIGSIFTSSSVGGWYSVLQKPTFNPPSWIFPVVWNFLFILMGISLYFLIFSKSKFKKTALWLFGIQLGLNLLWSILFFALRNPLFALIEIFVLWVFILLTIIYSFKVNKKSGYLLLPYILWVSFAIILNFAIVLIN